MSSRWLLLGLWVLGTVVAATVAWRSLGLVGATIDGDTQIASEAGPTLPPIDAAASTITAPAAAGSVTNPAAVGGTSDASIGAVPSSTTVATAVAGTGSATVQLVLTQGGQAEISFSPTEVKVLWAVPADGFVATTQVDDDEIEVEFRSRDARYQIDAWWDDGPRYEVKTKDPNDD
jgi:hypothetical protein